MPLVWLVCFCNPGEIPGLSGIYVPSEAMAHCLKYSSDDVQRKYTVFYKCFIYFLFEHFSFGSKTVLNLSEYFYLQEVKAWSLV